MNDGIEGRVVEGQMVAESGMVGMLNKGEIDMQIATAHKYPRSLKRFRDESLQMVTLNERVAESCIYALPRGNKTIEGPSARFAEVIASAWGNCRAGARTISDQGEFVTAQGVFHDLERNVAITYEVQRRITDSKGKRYNVDMIGVTANAACSVALRNAILKGVPKAFWDDMYQAARQTVMGDFKTLANRRAEALKAFQALGVSEAQLFAKLEVTGIEDITLEHLVILRGLITAIKEGDTTPEQTFGQSQAKRETATLPAYSQAGFDSNMAAWRKSVEKGKRTPEEIIGMVQSKYAMTEAQVAAIKALKPGVNKETGETTSLLDDVKRICAAAIAITDRETAFLRLDDARILLPEMSDENRALANKEITAAGDAIKSRKD
jgi:hypothetical protein